MSMSPKTIRNWFRLRTRLKLGINRLLEPLGLQLTASAGEKAERARLRKLQARGYWSQPRYTAGLAFHDARPLEFLRQVCAPHGEVFRTFPVTREEAGGK